MVVRTSRDEIVGNAVEILSHQIDGLQQILLPSVENIRDELGGVKSSIATLEQRIQEAREHTKELYESRNDLRDNLTNLHNEANNAVTNLSNEITRLYIRKSELETLLRTAETIVNMKKTVQNHTEQLKIINDKHKTEEVQKKTFSERLFVVLWDIGKLAIAALLGILFAHYGLGTPVGG